MFTSGRRNLARLFLILFVLVSSVVVLAFDNSSAKNSVPQACRKDAAVRPCCSACEVDPIPSICRYGCTEGC